MVPAQPAPTRKLTYADYCQIPDDGQRHEIVDGIHYVSPAPRYIHQQIIINLASMLHRWVLANKLGVVLMAPFDILLSDHDIIQPDILFISNENRSILTEKNARGAPDIAIEVLSPSNPNHDRVLKYRQYEHFGIKEYWIVDPAQEEVRISRLVEGRYQDAAVIRNELEDVLESELLPGFLLPVSQVFYRP